MYAAFSIPSSAAFSIPSDAAFSIPSSAAFSIPSSTGNDAETLYTVMNGRHFNGGCCFDYGNAESNNLDTGAGSMEAIYFGNSRGWGHGAGTGPWVMADLENGMQHGE